MLLPTTLPSATSVSPERAALTLTANSGALVPKATTVRPTTTGGDAEALRRRRPLP